MSRSFPSSTAAPREVGERIRLAIAGTPFQLPDGQIVNITVSAGISSFPNNAADAQRTVSTADQALYAAKQEGRNRVLLYHDILKARLEKNPELVVELLNQSLDHALPISRATSVLAPFLRRHCRGTEQAAEFLAGVLELPAEERECLRLAALLHDVGMFAMPVDVLNKQTPLSAEEQEILRRHPAAAAAWLAQVPALAAVAPVVRHHHERYDGQGYPDGLRGEEIPLLARALALADAYTCMLAEWPGRPALTPPEIQAELRACAGGQFDPVLVERFLQALAARVGLADVQGEG